MVNESKLNQWIGVYGPALANAVEQHPDEYIQPFPIESTVEKMRAAFERGSFNKDGRAIKATCKHFGIPYTYAGINAFLERS